MLILRRLSLSIIAFDTQATVSYSPFTCVCNRQQVIIGDWGVYVTVAAAMVELKENPYKMKGFLAAFEFN